MAKQATDTKTTDLFSARSKNALRQSIFKAKMRAEGKKQVVLWLCPEEERLIKLMLESRRPAGLISDSVDTFKKQHKL